MFFKLHCTLKILFVFEREKSVVSKRNEDVVVMDCYEFAEDRGW